MNLNFSNLFNNFFSKQKFFRKEIQISEHNIDANYFHKNVLIYGNILLIPEII